MESNKAKRLTKIKKGFCKPLKPASAYPAFSGRDRGPMYLLTFIAIKPVRNARKIVHSYMHRCGSPPGQIEQAFRAGKAELGLESPRLWLWKNRLKLLGVVALVYDFLLSLLRNWPGWIALFLKRWVLRTGNRHRSASVPIYRLRLAIANAFNDGLRPHSKFGMTHVCYIR